MPKFDLYIFDLDGTLADSCKDITSAANYARSLKALPPLDAATVRSFIGDGVSTLIERVLNELPKSEALESMEHFNSYYARHLTDSTILYPGIKEILTSLSGAKKAVLSNKPELFSKEILIKLGIAHHFSVIHGGDTSAKRKPSPEPVLNILQKLSCAPGKAIIIGDGINDILAARSCSIKSCAVGYGFTKESDLRALNPDYFAETPKELLTVLSLFNRIEL